MKTMRLVLVLFVLASLFTLNQCRVVEVNEKVFRGGDPPPTTASPIMCCQPQTCRTNDGQTGSYHRYYGGFNPFGSREAAHQNSSTLGHFSSSQALADYAEFITNLKNLSAENCPVVVMGGSYGGMLASWFRLKYSHIAIGALASSAPILYFDDITPQNGYLSVVTKDFNETRESCYETIRESWSEIDKMASQQNGLNLLTEKFNTCRPLNNSELLKEKLEDLYFGSAQYGTPWHNSVAMICNGIDGTPQGTDILARIFSGVEAIIGKQ